MSKKIYLSPSNQNGNLYAYGNTNEMEQCNRIADAALQYSCWRIPGTEEPGGLESMGSQRVGHD